LAAIAQSLGVTPGGPRGQLLQLAIAFPTWRSLVVGQGMDSTSAAALMTDAVCAAR